MKQRALIPWGFPHFAQKEGRKYLLPLSLPVNLPLILFLSPLSPRVLWDNQYLLWVSLCTAITALQIFSYFWVLHTVRDAGRGIPIARLGSALVTSGSIAVKWIELTSLRCNFCHSSFPSHPFSQWNLKLPTGWQREAAWLPDLLIALKCR